MDFKPMNTADHATNYRKVLLYAHHGWGKTTQAKHYQRKYGNGFIISGESGLGSIRSAGIDYLPFHSWDNGSDPANGVYSFKDILRYVNSPAFKAMGYKWIMIDSLTELADHAMSFAEAEAAKKPTKDGKVNGFAVWDEYASFMLGACKWVRDQPMHVIVTALAKEGEDENGNKEYWPMVKGKQVQTQLPGIFDCVLCGIKRSQTQTDQATNESLVKTQHYIVTDTVSGWRAKVRDEKRRLKPVEIGGDITKLFDKMDAPDSEYEKVSQQKENTNGI